MFTFFSFTLLLTFSCLVMVTVSAPSRVRSSFRSRAVIDVCLTLKQNQLDTAMCCDKARGNTITAGETASLVYLCCLGYFNDVKQNYMDHITFDLLLHIVRSTQPDELKAEARFIMACQDTPGGKMNLNDFKGWYNGKRTRAECRSRS